MRERSYSLRLVICRCREKLKFPQKYLPSYCLQFALFKYASAFYAFVRIMRNINTIKSPSWVEFAVLGFNVLYINVCINLCSI